MFLLSLILTMVVLVQAQTHESIRTGRPGQSIGPAVVGTGILQIQSGFDNSWQDSQQRNQSASRLNNIIRYGLSESFEISALIDYDFHNEELVTGKFSGLSSTQVGFRYNVIDKPNGLIPALGIQVRFRTRLISDELAKPALSPVFIFASQHRLTQTFALVNNFGISYDGFQIEPRSKWITNLSHSIDSSWGVFVETYGHLQGLYASAFADTGVSYLMYKDLQFDMYGGWGHNHGQTETFVSVGLSWRRLPGERFVAAGI